MAVPFRFLERPSLCREVLCWGLAPQQAFDLLGSQNASAYQSHMGGWGSCSRPELKGPGGLCHAEKLVSSYRDGYRGAPGIQRREAVGGQGLCEGGI